MSKPAGPTRTSHSPSSVTHDGDTSKKGEVIDVDMKLQHNTTTIRGPLRRGKIKLCVHLLLGLMKSTYQSLQCSNLHVAKEI